MFGILKIRKTHKDVQQQMSIKYKIPLPYSKDLSNLGFVKVPLGHLDNATNFENRLLRTIIKR